MAKLALPEEFAEGEGSRRLVVLLHAAGQTSARMVGVCRAVQERLPDADTWLPTLPITHLLTRTRGATATDDLTRRLGQLVDNRERRGGSYEEIILVGHSYGAALARAIWAKAMGGQLDGTADLRAAFGWAPKISRLILLAAVARGWNQLAPVTTKVRVAVWLGSLLEVVTGPGWGMLDVRRGAPWITTTRLQTIDLNRKLEASGRKPPVTVQLLGAVDNVVAPADNVDLAAGSNFFYVDVPGTDHLNVVDVEGEVGAERRRLLLEALTQRPENLRALAVSPEELRDMVDENLNDHDVDWTDPGGNAAGTLPLSVPVRTDVECVVFLTHGIRDYGYWTKRLAVRIKEAGRNRRPNPIKVRTVTSSYGFFPMGPFVLRAERRKRAGWLMDQYVTAKATYPNARFSFIGHSNGTYLAVNALKECPAIRFENIVFAGSVVRTNFEWQDLMKPQEFGERKPQVERVLNYVATGDIVVALFPGGMQWMGFADLGGAGHHGFKPEPQPNVENIFYVPGGHNAALKDHHWSEIADFALGGEFLPGVIERRPPYREDRWTPLVGAVGHAAGLVFLAFAAIVLSIISGMVWGLAGLGIAALLVGLPLLTVLAGRVLTKL